MLRWTERAVNDLFAIGEYTALDNPAAARAWVEELRQRAVKASRMPRAGRVVPEIARDDVREVFQRTYRIVYRIVDDDIADGDTRAGRGRRHQGRASMRPSTIVDGDTQAAATVGEHAL